MAIDYKCSLKGCKSVLMFSNLGQQSWNKFSCETDRLYTPANCFYFYFFAFEPHAGSALSLHSGGCTTYFKSGRINKEIIVPML
jgi:hypothetical protein